LRPSMDGPLQRGPDQVRSIAPGVAADSSLADLDEILLPTRSSGMRGAELIRTIVTLDVAATLIDSAQKESLEQQYDMSSVPGFDEPASPHSAWPRVSTAGKAEHIELGSSWPGGALASFAVDAGSVLAAQGAACEWPKADAVAAPAVGAAALEVVAEGAKCEWPKAKAVAAPVASLAMMEVAQAEGAACQWPKPDAVAAPVAAAEPAAVEAEGAASERPKSDIVEAAACVWPKNNVVPAPQLMHTADATKGAVMELRGAACQWPKAEAAVAPVAEEALAMEAPVMGPACQWPKNSAVAAPVMAAAAGAACEWPKSNAVAAPVVAGEAAAVEAKGAACEWPKNSSVAAPVKAVEAEAKGAACQWPKPDAVAATAMAAEEGAEQEQAPGARCDWPKRAANAFLLLLVNPKAVLGGSVGVGAGIGLEAGAGSMGSMLDTVVSYGVALVGA